MTTSLCLAIVFWGMFNNTLAEAYELATHARLSWNGYLQSRLNLDAAKRGSLGLPKGSNTDLGGTYRDCAPDGRSNDRGVKEYHFDNDKSPPVTGVANEVVRVIHPGWLVPKQREYLDSKVLRTSNGSSAHNRLAHCGPFWNRLENAGAS